MWTKKSKIIYCIIIILLILFGIKSFNDRKKESIKFVGHYDNLYYGVRYTGSSGYEEKLSNLKLVTYNSNTKEKIKYDLENIEENMIIDINSLKSFDNWLLMQSLNSTNLYGVDVNTGDVKVLIKNDKKDSIKTFALSDNKLIYTTLVSNFSDIPQKFSIDVINIDSNEIMNLGTFENAADIPVSIYKNKATYLIDNKITVVDLTKNETLATSLPVYSGSSFIFKDNIYTFRMDTGSYVTLDLNLTEKEILKNANISSFIYADNDKVVSSNYFYDTNADKLYVRKIGNNLSSSREILGNYIYSYKNKYELLKEDENYFEYNLKGDMFIGNSLHIDTDTFVKVLTTGELIVTSSDSNEIIKSNAGFTNTDKYRLWDCAYNKNKVYSIEGTDTSLLALVGVDIDTGNKEIIKEFEEPIENIKQVAAYGNEVGTLIQRADETIFSIINLETKEETILKLDINTEISDVLFNERYIAILSYDPGTIRLFGKYTGNILAVSKEEYLSLMGISQEGIIASSSSDYQLLDFSLKIVKDYSNYDKAIKYLYKK